MKVEYVDKPMFQVGDNVWHTIGKSFVVTKDETSLVGGKVSFDRANGEWAHKLKLIKPPVPVVAMTPERITLLYALHEHAAKSPDLFGLGDVAELWKMLAEAGYHA